MYSNRFTALFLILTLTLFAIGGMVTNAIAPDKHPHLEAILPASSNSYGVASDNTTKASSEQETAFRSSPVMFIENAGQWADGARFQVWGSAGGTMWLAEDAIWITAMEPPGENEQIPPEGRFDPTSDLRPPISEPRSGVNIKLSFPGANPHPTIEPFDRLDTTISYFYGNDPDQRQSRLRH